MCQTKKELYKIKRKRKKKEDNFNFINFYTLQRVVLFKNLLRIMVFDTISIVIEYYSRLVEFVYCFIYKLASEI